MTTPPPRGGRIEALIRATYDQLADVPGQPVRIRVLREAIARTPDPPHPLMVDNALDVMSLQPGVHIRASVDQQHLTAADREHGVLLGGQWRHNIQIETPDAPSVSATPPPTPDLPRAAPRRAAPRRATGRSQQPAPRAPRAAPISTDASTGARGGVDAVAEAVPTIWPDDPKSATARILTAYQRLSRGQPGTWVGLAAIRETFDMPDDEIRAAVEHLIASPGCHVVAGADLRALTQADHDAAVWCAGTWRHTMMIEQPLRRR